jgi:uncharacterized protein (DUF58 family)
MFSEEIVKKRSMFVLLLAIAGLLLVACQPETVEVTRVITETIVQEGETVEVTRVVTEVETVTEEVEVEVTKVVEVAGEAAEYLILAGRFHPQHLPFRWHQRSARCVYHLGAAGPL